MAETLKHTPGPWEAIAEKDDGNFAHSIYTQGYKGLLIARCNQNGNYNADACLIAAAPDLLEALELHVRYEAIPSDRGGKSGPKSVAWNAFVEARNNAIAKAEGRS